MSAFDKIIGYSSIKEELEQICDMIHNRDVYKALGAAIPHGVLLYGDPGLGKTLMAKCFIEESGFCSYTIRKNNGNDFIGEIIDTFRKALDSAPAVVFLDDLDKFANEDSVRRDAEEYVAVQAGIDEIKDSGVFVFATVNNIYKLPSSLTRSGRFDRKIEVKRPNSDDAYSIIKHYLSNKKVSADISIEDLTKMISYSSCADLETIMNEAAILAGYKRKEFIEMEELKKAVLRIQYNSSGDIAVSSCDEIEKTAVHEAGHLVVCEILCPCSVGLASIRRSGSGIGGFVQKCKKLARPSHDILVSLAGKAAVELYFAEDCAEGCEEDIKRAYTNIRDRMSNLGTHGFGMINVETRSSNSSSQSLDSRTEAVVQAELEKYMLKTRDILLKNREFLEKVKNALVEKETLLFSDIRSIRESVTICSAA